MAIKFPFCSHVVGAVGLNVDALEWNIPEQDINNYVKQCCNQSTNQSINQLDLCQFEKDCQVLNQGKCSPDLWIYTHIAFAHTIAISTYISGVRVTEEKVFI